MRWINWYSDLTNPEMRRVLDVSVRNEIPSNNSLFHPQRDIYWGSNKELLRNFVSSLKNFVRKSISAWWIALQKTILQRCCIDLTKKPWVQYTCTDRLWRICCESFSNLDYEFMDVFKKSLQDLKILWRKVCRIEELSEEKLFPASWRIDWCNKMKVRFQNLLDLDYEFTDQINLSILHCLKVLNLDYEFMDLLQNDDQRLENFVKKSSSYQRIVWRKVVLHIETHRLMQ